MKILKNTKSEAFNSLQSLKIFKFFYMHAQCIFCFQIDKMYQEGEAVIMTMGQYFYINITSKRN